MPLFGPTMHRGPVKRSVHFTLSQILPLIHSLFQSFFSPVFGFLCHNMNRFDTKCNPAWPEGHEQPLKPKTKTLVSQLAPSMFATDTLTQIEILQFVRKQAMLPVFFKVHIMYAEPLARYTWYTGIQVYIRMIFSKKSLQISED